MKMGYTKNSVVFFIVITAIPIVAVLISVLGPIAKALLIRWFGW
jgi:hypothetical protein